MKRKGLGVGGARQEQPARQKQDGGGDGGQQMGK